LVRQIKLRSGLILVVAAALIPVSILSAVQAYSELNYTRTLLGNKLVVSALATAGYERDQIVIAEQVLLTLSQIPMIREIQAGCEDRLRAGLVGNTSFLNFARSDAQGRVRCSITPFEPGLSFAGEDWWMRGIKKSRFSVSSPVFGPITKRQILVGLLPISAPNGANDGAISVAIDFSWLKKSLASATLDENALIGVAEADGSLLITSGAASRPKFNPQTAVGTVAEVADKAGAIWMYSAAPLYGRDLFVIYAEPRQALMATALAQARINLILPVIVLILTVIAIWFGTNRLVIKWLDSLRALASQFMAGNYESDTGRFDKAPTEIAALSEGLYAMASAVGQRDHDLNAALAAKTNMTLEIHHRVKNNLQIVSSLLNLQARRISDPSAKSALDQTRARIGALAQIHRLLYEDANDSEHGNVDIAQLMNQLCIQLRLLHRHQSGVDLICVVDPFHVPVDNAVPLSLFAVEAITNVYRHGFPDGRSGTVTLGFSVTDHHGQMRISDNGVGFDSGEDFTSMGHQLMSAFAHQLGGKLVVESIIGSGTMVTLTYPIPLATQTPPQ
jgi:two-component sensor histidine kinase